jgi:hypothetical protein
MQSVYITTNFVSSNRAQARWVQTLYEKVAFNCINCKCFSSERMFFSSDKNKIIFLILNNTVGADYLFLHSSCCFVCVCVYTTTLTLCWIIIVVLLCCHDNCRCLLNIYMYLQLSIISGHTWRSIGYFSKFTSQENVPEILRLKN